MGSVEESGQEAVLQVGAILLILRLAGRAGVERAQRARRGGRGRVARVMGANRDLASGLEAETMLVRST